jgi:hypothetical protein
MRGAAPALLLVSLAACAAAPQTRPGLPPAHGLSLVPAAEGLDVAPLGQEIGFGRHRPGAVAAVARILGRDGVPARPAACPGGALEAVAWPREGLTLYFAEEAFVGWRTVPGRRFAEAASAGRVCG